MTIATGPVTQLCWVTEDIEATERFLSANFGVGAWTRLPDIRFGPDACTLRGEPADFTVHVSLGYAGDLQLEIIQPVSGTSIYTEFLAVSPPGLHHLCFEVDDMAVALESAREAGVEVVQAGSMMGGGMEFAYLDGAHAGVPYVELARIGPEMRAFYDALKAG
ncbi:VOC family protein [Marmoricola sp. RAF53]|uniref:VOC family protein n=1 Tax=Marmoricola sp. RAF53 TaxID=3233059 RepID=UPI003F95C413